jgi:hypothetical protein
MRAVVTAFVALLLVASVRTADAQLACGDVIERKIVSLTGDLDCTGFPDRTLVLHRATLKLNGFTVRGGEGINCAASCRVIGPGVVENSTESGIWSNLWFATRFTLSKVTVRNNALWGVAGYISASNGQSVVVVRDSLIESNGLSGIYADVKATVVRSTIRGNGTFNGGVGVALRQGDAVVSGSTIEDNLGQGVWARGNVRLVGSTVTGNELGGVFADETCSDAGRATVIGSTVTGNSSPGCAAGECADVESCVAPKVVRSTCETSHRAGSGSPGDDWNVCALD